MSSSNTAFIPVALAGASAFQMRGASCRSGLHLPFGDNGMGIGVGEVGFNSAREVNAYAASLQSVCHAFQRIYACSQVLFLGVASSSNLNP